MDKSLQLLLFRIIAYTKNILSVKRMDSKVLWFHYVVIKIAWNCWMHCWEIKNAIKIKKYILDCTFQNQLIHWSLNSWYTTHQFDN